MSSSSSQGNASSGNINGTKVYGGVCPAGHYCTAGTIRATDHPCPNGTYNPLAGGKSLSACLPCDGGKVCNGQGLPQPNDLCAPGFYCISGARSPTPTDGVTGNICPIGHYCPGNTSYTLSCMSGTYR